MAPIALYSSALKGHASFTKWQIPPEECRWVGPEDDHVAALATTDSAAAMMRACRVNGKPSIWWRAEARWIEQFMESKFGRPPDPDFIISNQKVHVLEGAQYMTLFGTWITETEIPTKTELVSMVASYKKYADVAGYDLRRTVAKMLGGVQFEHGYGKSFMRPIRDKFIGIAPYRFSIAIESENYPWFHTEKLFDCFATKTVPLYWGCSDFSKLIEYGYDPLGIITWKEPTELKAILDGLDESTYYNMRRAIEHNYRRTREEYCSEIPLARLLREKMGL